MSTSVLQSGIHPSAEENIKTDFSKAEKAIVTFWSKDWFITSAGKRMTPGRSIYKFFLAKPVAHVEEALNISREIIVILSPYKDFEPRSLEAFDSLREEFIEQRYETICYVLISGDELIETKLRSCLTNRENQVVVPFSYSSFEANRANMSFIRNTFQKFFYSRDLFDYSEPLKKETFFFGRSDIVTSVIEKHKSGSNYGLFGLRKTGKTSIIYDVIRKSASQDFTAVFIDCQDTSFNMRRWNYALCYVINRVAEAANVEGATEEQFSCENAGNLFRTHISRIVEATGKRILILFDEIENITFGKSGAEHWCNDLDFVYFWQSIRSAYQSLSPDGSLYEFTFCIFGTNAKCVEEPRIKTADNPIYNIFQPFYIPGFDYRQTREMVRKLSRIMGLKFEEEIYSHLLEDYGGHPFLVRRVCSKIAQLHSERPVTIDRIKYQEAKKQFNIENVYFEMILDVLKQFYSDEYEMLNFLAIDDKDNFNYFVREDHALVSHLIGYGLIRECDENRYDFRLDAIKEYLVRQNNSHPHLVTPEEKWSHLCTQRNKLEIELRKIVKAIIRIAYKNESAAKDYVIRKIYAGDPKYSRKTYSELFDSRNSLIYLKNLTDLINANWEYFSDYFGKQDIFNLNLAVLNAEGRFDAHASIPNTEEINAVDHAADYVWKAIEKYNS